MRITTLGPSDRLGAAILPVPARIGQAYQTRGSVCGQPGTQPIAAPNPAGVPQAYPFTALHKSSDGPQWWRPSVYYQRGPLGSNAPVSTESDNQMPVPAGTPSGKPAVMLKSPTFLGQRQVGAVNAIPVFAWRGR